MTPVEPAFILLFSVRLKGAFHGFATPKGVHAGGIPDRKKVEGWL